MTMTSAELRTLVTCQSGLLDVDCTGEVIEKADFEIFRNMVTPPHPLYCCHQSIMLHNFKQKKLDLFNAYF